MHDFNAIMNWARAAHASGLLSRDLRSPEAAAYIIASGLEIGLQPMQALRDLRIIQGRVTLPAAVMQSMAHRAGVAIDWQVSSDTLAEVKLSREGQRPYSQRFSIDDAARAGLAGQQTWRQYPAAMLRARCISAAIRAYCPDVLGGGAVYVPGETGDPSEADLTLAEKPAALPDHGTIESATIEAAPARVLAEPARVEKAIEALRGEGLYDAIVKVHGEPATWTDAELAAFREAIREHRAAATKAAGPPATDAASTDAADVAAEAVDLAAQLVRQPRLRRAVLEQYGAPADWSATAIGEIRAKLDAARSG